MPAVWSQDRQLPFGTPKGQLTKPEAHLLEKPWHDARPNVKVKLLARDGETYVFAQSEDRIAKERSMRRRRLRKYLKALADLTGRKRPLKRDELHQALGAAKKGYCLQVTLKARIKRCASGLTPRAVLEKFAAVQMLDVHFPTTDGREIILTRYTQPEKDLQLLLHELQLKLPEQPPIQNPSPAAPIEIRKCCSADLLTTMS